MECKHIDLIDVKNKMVIATKKWTILERDIFALTWTCIEIPKYRMVFPSIGMIFTYQLKNNIKVKGK